VKRNKSELVRLSRQARSLVRAGKYIISEHALNDHPERDIKIEDILEVLKIGEAISEEPREVDGVEIYRGTQRYRWFGEDQNDRVLRLIVVIKANVVIISAAIATERQAERYRAEDQED